VLACQEVIIPPLCQQAVECRTDLRITADDRWGIFQTISPAGNEIALVDSYGHVDLQGKVKLWITNLSSKPVIIPFGHEVAIFDKEDFQEYGFLREESENAQLISLIEKCRHTPDDTHYTTTDTADRDEKTNPTSHDGTFFNQAELLHDGNHTRELITGKEIIPLHSFDNDILFRDSAIIAPRGEADHRVMITTMDEDIGSDLATHEHVSLSFPDLQNIAGDTSELLETLDSLSSSCNYHIASSKPLRAPTEKIVIPSSDPITDSSDATPVEQTELDDRNSRSLPSAASVDVDQVNASNLKLSDAVLAELATHPEPVSFDELPDYFIDGQISDSLLPAHLAGF
jgi:hypothetical protein